MTLLKVAHHIMTLVFVFVAPEVAIWLIL